MEEQRRTDREKYVGWSSDDAVKHYLARITAKIPHFETMEEPDLNYIKVFCDVPSFRIGYCDRESNKMIDDQCWRASYCEQLYIWLHLSPNSLLFAEPTYQIKAHILRSGKPAVDACKHHHLTLTLGRYFQGRRFV